jgi:uncharacterized protein YjdB
MSNYIGTPFINQVSPAFQQEDFTDSSFGNITVGSITHANSVALSQAVPGANGENLLVVINNVIQQATSAFTIEQDANAEPKILKLAGAPDSGSVIYVVHRGIGSFQMKPPTGSVGQDELAANLKSFTNDVFTGDGSAVAFTLSETPPNSNSVLVFVDGILQKSSTNYSISGTTLTFTSAPDTSAEIEAKHFGIRGVVRRSTDFQYDSFTGNGSLTAFTLSTSGATTNSAFIFYNGIALKPTSDYSISGTTLTLTFAPVASSEIMARYQL